MPFNSYLYVFLFLPLAVAGFYFIARLGTEAAAVVWLVLLSLVFYGFWNPAYIPLLLLSIVFNYLIGSYLQTAINRRMARFLLTLGVIANLLLLGYYKYAGFFAEIASMLTGADFQLGLIILPLGISFFTFQQIAYLVESYKQQAASGGFLRYCLFVTFFPKLITGPIVRHKEMMPQLLDSGVYRFVPINLMVGFGIFTIGLFKKVVIADPLASVVSPAFSLASAGQDPGFYVAWLAAFAYALQVYFDFSGYTDMAIGAALMFGIHLPINFFSPYKSASIAEFWRRWHMTLTRFITEYIFTPVSLRFSRLSLAISSNRGVFLLLGTILPFFVSFSIIGFWHGAGWNFILFGVFHGFLMSLHASWQEIRRALGMKSQIPKGLGVAMTLLAWVLGLVLFRSTDLTTLSTMYKSMLGFSAVLQGPNLALGSVLSVVLMYLFVLMLPNTEQLFHQHRPKLPDKNMEKSRSAGSPLTWRENRIWAVLIGVLFFVGVAMMSTDVEFIYFQF